MRNGRLWPGLNLVSLLFTVSIVLSFAACGGGSNDNGIDLNATFSSSPDQPRVHETVTLDGRESTSSTGDALSFEWSVDGEILPDQNEVVHHEFTQTGDHDVTLTVSVPGGPSDSISRTLHVLEPDGNEEIFARFEFHPAFPEPGETVHFDAFESQSNQGEITSWTWGFPDGTSEEGHETTFTFSEDGSFPVQLVVRDAAGNTDIITRSVPVITPFYVLHDPVLPRPGETVRFDASSFEPPSGEARFDWTFADGDSFDGPVGEHMFDEEGEFTVELTIADDDGDIHEMERTVTVREGWTQFRRDSGGASRSDQPALITSPSVYNTLLTVEEGSFWGSPVAADLTGSGTLEILIGSSSGPDHPVMALNSTTGEPVWTFTGAGDSVQSTPAAADLTGNGQLEVIVGSNDGNVYALRTVETNGDYDVEELWGSPFSTDGAVLSSASVADLTGDGEKEVVIGSNDGNLYAIDGGTGQLAWDLPYSTGDEIGFSSPALGDLTGNGMPDVIIGSSDEDKQIHAVTGSAGESIWSFDVGSTVYGSPALGDLTGDGVLDVVFGTVGTIVDEVEGIREASVHALHGPDGSEIWQFTVPERVHASPSLGDLTGNGRPDVVIGTMGASNGRIYALDGVGGEEMWSVLPEYENGEGGQSIHATPALTDLTGDGSLDVVVAGNASSTSNARVFAFDGRPDLEEEERLLWKVPMPWGVRSSPALADVTGDGFQDVIAVAGAGDGHVHILHQDPMPWAEMGRNAENTSTVVPAEPYSRGTLDEVPSREIWSNEAEAAPGPNQPTLADLNRDGFLDVIVGSDQGVQTFSGEDGRHLWTYSDAGSVPGTPLVANFTGSPGDVSVVFGTEEGVFAIDGTDGETEHWRSEPDDIGAVNGSPTLARKDGRRVFDGIDVLVGSDNGSVYGLDGESGSIVWSETTNGSIVGAPALQTDSNIVVVATQEGIVYGLSPAGNHLTDSATDILWSYAAGDTISSPPVVGNLAGGSGVIEPLILMGVEETEMPNTVVITDNGIVHAIEVFFFTGTDNSPDPEGVYVAESLWIHALPASSTVSPFPLAVGDLDGTNGDEVIVSGGGGTVYALDGDGDGTVPSIGSERWVQSDLGQDTPGTPVVIDITGDGNLNVMVATSDGTAYVLDVDNGDIVWDYSTDDEGLSMLVPGDINRSGFLEVVITHEGGGIYVVGEEDN